MAVHVTGRGTRGLGERGECQPFSVFALIYNVSRGGFDPIHVTFDDRCISQKSSVN